MKPKRIQRRRTKGWTAPEGAVGAVDAATEEMAVAVGVQEEEE